MPLYASLIDCRTYIKLKYVRIRVYLYVYSLRWQPNCSLWSNNRKVIKSTLSLVYLINCLLFWDLASLINPVSLRLPAIFHLIYIFFCVQFVCFLASYLIFLLQADLCWMSFPMIERVLLWACINEIWKSVEELPKSTLTSEHTALHFKCSFSFSLLQ